MKLTLSRAGVVSLILLAYVWSSMAVADVLNKCGVLPAGSCTHNCIVWQLYCLPSSVGGGVWYEQPVVQLDDDQRQCVHDDYGRAQGASVDVEWYSATQVQCHCPGDGGFYRPASNYEGWVKGDKGPAPSKVQIDCTKGKAKLGTFPDTTK